MKKKRTKIILTAVISAIIVILFWGMQKKHLVAEQTKQVIVPADFVESKRQALDLLGGLANHGFRIRDEVWEISLKPKKMKLLQLTLFAGNQYWFAGSASAPAQRLKLALYDNDGNPVTLDLWKDNHVKPGARIAGGALISRSGNYYVGLELLEEEGEQEAVPASLVYAYQ